MASAAQGLALFTASSFSTNLPSVRASTSASAESSTCSSFTSSSRKIGYKQSLYCPQITLCTGFGSVNSIDRRRLRTGIVLCRAAYGGGGALSPELKASLDKFIGSHKVVLFMKGNRNFPQCGFSNTCIQILNQFQVPYETVNILEDEALRQGVKEYSKWPTYPQLYIDGEFYGGCDITMEAYKSGELQEAIEKAMVS